MKEYKIGNNEEGQRFDKLLTKILNQATKGFIYKMLRKKNITLNNKKATGNEILKVEDVVKIFLSDETFDKFSKSVVADDYNYINREKNYINHQSNNTKEDKNNGSKVNKKTRINSTNSLNKKFSLNIIAETKDYMIINKPVGMLSQKAKGSDISLVEYIVAYMLDKGEIDNKQLQTFKPSVCNRLDRNTSGVIIAGKSLIGLQKMTEYIKNRDIDKYYLALVKGKITKGDKIDGYLVKDSDSNTVKVIKSTSKVIDFNENKRMDSRGNGTKNNKQNKNENEIKLDYIKTEYEPVSYNDNYTLLKVKLITGKTHQIRAHLSSINHPIIGDYKYGDRTINDKFKKKYKLESQLLHSYEVVFNNNDEDILKVKGKVYQAELNEVFKKIVEDLIL